MRRRPLLAPVGTTSRRTTRGGSRAAAFGRRARRAPRSRPARRRRLAGGRGRASPAARHADPEVRVRALVQLAATGDAGGLRGGGARGRARALRRPDRPPRGCGRPRRTRGGRRRFGGTRHAPGRPRPDRAGRGRGRRLPADAAEPEVVRRVVAAVEPAPRGAHPPRSGGSATSRAAPRGGARSRRQTEAGLVHAAATAARHGVGGRRSGTRRSGSHHRARGARRPRCGGRRRRVTCGRARPGVPGRGRRTPPEPRPRAPPSPSSTGRWAGRWTTSSIWRGSSSSQRSPSDTGNESGPPCGSWITRTASAGRSESRRWTSSSRETRPRSPSRSCAETARAWRAGRRGSAANARGVARRHHERSWPRLALVVARCVRTSRGSRLTAARRVRSDSRRPGRVLDLLRHVHRAAHGRQASQESRSSSHRQHAVRRRPARGRVARRARQAAADEPVPVGT